MVAERKKKNKPKELKISRCRTVIFSSSRNIPSCWFFVNTRHFNVSAKLNVFEK